MTGGCFRARRVRLPFAAVAALGLVFAFASVGSAADPTIEPSFGSSGYSWSPSSVTVSTGGTVAFKNSSDVVPHGVRWTGGPEKPGCSSGVAVEQEKTSWSGTCTFAQAGTYSFVCTVHPIEMKGTIAVGSTGEPPPPPAEESPLRGPASRALKLAKSQRGSSVRGSIDLTQASAGGRLEVLLFMRKAGGSAGARVGRLVRSPLGAGIRSFSVPLKSSARRALRSRGRLSLSAQVIVTPLGGTGLTLKRGVTLHA